MNEWIDDDGYPSEEAIERIYNFHGTPQQFIEYITDIWAYRLCGTDSAVDDYGKPYTRFHLATGGWSGNETVISAVERTMFSFMFWQSSHRGGGYEYRVRDSLLHEPCNLGVISKD